MKRLISIALILSILVMILSGCSINGKGTFGAKEKEVISQLNSMKEQGNKPKEMFDYLNQNISLLDKKGATEALGILVGTLEEFETIYNERLFTENIPDLMFKYFEFKFDYNKIDSIKEQELKDLLTDIVWGGFKIVDTEGTFMVVVDYDNLRTFNNNVDDEINTYIDIMALRYNDPISIDEGLAIAPEELVNRIIQMENYLKSYDNNQRKEIMISMYEGYIMVYMSGTDNTPVFDFDTGTINPDMFKRFETTASKQKDSVFGKILSKYVELLKQEGFINTEKVQDFILNIDTIVIEELANSNNK
ncbi:MAG: hypothetical protein WBL93_08520 [Lutisporaceae bacterium]